MRIITKAELIWNEQAQRYFTHVLESYEYEGPLALCDRSQSHAIANQGSQQAGQDQASAQQELGSANADISNYKTNLSKFMAANPYTAGGAYDQAQKIIGTSSAQAGNQSLKDALARSSMRSGENTANYAATAAEAGRQSQRDLTDFMAKQTADRINKDVGVQQFGVTASGLPADLESRLYGTAIGGAGSQLSTAANAAKTPGFMDMILPSLIQGGATVGAAFCPCEGSMISMGDQSEKPVELTIGGEFLFTLGWTSPPNELMETPQPRREHCFEIVTAKGLRHRGSKTHAVMLASGGYSPLPELKGKTILTALETDVVVEVNDIGEKMVYPMAVGGSRCYMADKIWCLA